MGQRLDLGRAYGEIWIEKVGEADTIGLGREPKKTAIGIENVGAPRFQKFEPGLLASIDEALTHPTIYAEDQVQGIGAEFSDLNDLRDAGGVKTAQASAGLYVFEAVHLIHPWPG